MRILPPSVLGLKPLSFAVILLFSVEGGMVAAEKSPAIAPDFSDVSYGPHERNRLDLWLAKSGAPTPLVVFIHGGGWRSHDKSDVTSKVLKNLLGHGISVASINYRFSDQAQLPAPVHDAARAIQFLRSKATEWNLEPLRVGAMGISAGGCTTLWLAYHDDLADPASTDPVSRQSSRLQAAVGISAQTSIDPQVVVDWVGPEVMNHPMFWKAVGAKSKEDALAQPDYYAELFREFSPINHVSPDDPPVLLVYPSLKELPAANRNDAIHHALFGTKLQEIALSKNLVCDLQILDQEKAPPKTPEEFLREKLSPTHP